MDKAPLLALDPLCLPDMEESSSGREQTDSIFQTVAHQSQDAQVDGQKEARSQLCENVVSVLPEEVVYSTESFNHYASYLPFHHAPAEWLREIHFSLCV